MNKRIKIIAIICITIIIIILGYLQVQDIIIKKPSRNYVPITISEAKQSQDNNMTLSFLYHISKEKHPTGSDEIYAVKDYIINCLTDMNVIYDIQTINLDEDYFEQMKNENNDKMLKIKDNYYNDLKNQIGNIDVEQFVRQNTEYNSFEEMFKQEVQNGKDIEKELDDIYNEKIEKYKDKTLNNIFVKLNTNNNSNSQNLLLVAHYDSAEQSYGASDDGMAVAGLLETIRCMKNKNFNNNIYVLFTDGEEQKFWGANEFIKKNTIDFDLVINYDNAGNSGNLVLYHYSNDNLAKQYFKATSREVNYSITNELLYNPNNEHFQDETSDAFSFIKNGYSTLDFALASNPFYYHSEQDNFYNIDMKAQENMTKSMIESVEYYGNNKIEKANNDKFLNFKLLNGLELSISKTIYIVISAISIFISCIYIILLFAHKDKTIKKVLSIILTIVSLLTLVILKNLSLLFSIPCFILFITEIIKNDKLKSFIKVTLLEIYIFILIQLIVPLIQYLIWLTQLWGTE